MVKEKIKAKAVVNRAEDDIILVVSVCLRLSRGLECLEMVVVLHDSTSNRPFSN